MGGEWARDCLKSSRREEKGTMMSSDQTTTLGACTTIRGRGFAEYKTIEGRIVYVSW